MTKNLPIPINSPLILEAHIEKLDRMKMDLKVHTFFENAWSVPLTARALGVSRKALRKYIKQSPEFRLFVNRFESVLIARAESKLQDLIEEKHFPSIKFFLERRAPEKYGPKVEIITDKRKRKKMRITSEMTLEEAQRVFAEDMSAIDVTPKK